MQCLPVRQPDGGRDAIVHYDRRGDNFIVFQVKYVEKPLAVRDAHSWLVRVLEEEKPKVKNLIPKGAQEYYLLTNVPGTAHLDVESIDKVNNTLNTALSIPARCWWRDDLNQRLENHWGLKWSYPQLLSGTDMLMALVQSRLHTDYEEKMAIIRGFLRNQYELDKEVRFKQVQLENRLLDLYIDVPMLLSTFTDEPRKRTLEYRRRMYSFVSIAQDVLRSQKRKETELVEEPSSLRRSASRNFLFGEIDGGVAAASLMLNPDFQAEFPYIVVEGAPGQGKSTIAQYLCQIHRMKLLDVLEGSDSIPESHWLTGVRVPFKVDLKDYASWLDKRNPFLWEEDAEVPKNWKPTLEAFLAAQVEYLGGGASFTVDDLLRVARASAFLVVLDGLDEVADIRIREQVVKEVTASVRRLQQNAISLQVVVTSRPAAFSNSGGFVSRHFPHFTLESVDKNLINTYANKWLRAKNLHNRREGADVRKILRSKLDQPHLQDLARNPMQLAILLNLIHTRGVSLPDKRTALYDAYMELFFSREAEKSLIVREYRYLLGGIHSYLAWVLHSEAEEGQGRGRIGTDRLRAELEKYLTEQGYDASIADKLFPAMIDRVVALVSRVQGTYEFEVQPLREYFAARHLYDTAPHSAAGSERRGAKPDRFDAIARNFYWLNVTRFYSGCYSIGELSSLADSLSDLCQENDYRYINHPRVLAATLLSDWVFAQYPKAMKRVVNLLLDGLGLRYITPARDAFLRAADVLTLPDECGGEDLFERCFEILSEFPARDYAREVADLAVANSDKQRRLSAWMSNMETVSGEARTRWFEYGLYLGLLSDLPNKQLEAYLADDAANRDRFASLLKANRVDFIEGSEERAKAAVNLLLERIA